jgi:hypothetical protein
MKASTDSRIPLHCYKRTPVTPRWGQHSLPAHSTSTSVNGTLNLEPRVVCSCVRPRKKWSKNVRRSQRVCQAPWLPETQSPTRQRSRLSPISTPRCAATAAHPTDGTRRAASSNSLLHRKPPYHRRTDECCIVGRRTTRLLHLAPHGLSVTPSRRLRIPLR